MIVDDAGHDSLLMRQSLENLWKGLAPGGFYFVEDLYDFVRETVATPYGAQQTGIMSAIAGRAKGLVLSSKGNTASTSSLNSKVAQLSEVEDIGSDIELIECYQNLCVLRKRA